MATTSPLLASLDWDTLTRILERGLGAALGESVEIIDVRRLPFDGSSSFAVGRIEAVMRTGTTHAAFVKDLDPTHQLEEAKAVRDGDLERSRREVHVYRDVLPGLGLGTPALYGLLWDDDAGYVLLLEDAGPKRLSRLGDFELWSSAAGWLGRFHAAGRVPFPAWQLPAITIHDLASQGRRVHRVLHRLQPDVRRAAEQGLKRLDGLLDRLYQAGGGLVHGEFFGKNVVVRPAPATEPIAVIDWETAAIAPQYLDLVSISAGRWTPQQRQAMRRAYFDARSELDPTLPSWKAFNAEVDVAAVVNALAWLGRWSDGDDAHVERWGREVRYTVGPLLAGEQAGAG
jgi:aminoglycoside/choline kinase family phosphotransferase